MNVFRIKKDTPAERERRELKNECIAAAERIHTVRSRFQNVTDPNLIDACIYDLKAAQSEYAYLLGKVKEEQ